MNKILCAVVLAAMSAGPSRAANNALFDLKAAVSPSALEDMAVPSPEPAPAAAATPLSPDTIKGEYVVKTAGMPVLQIILAADVTLIKPDPAGDLVCKGAYKFDTAKSLLITDFTECGSSTFTHTMFLEGQTVESLQAGAKILSSILMDGDFTPSVPVKIQKVK